MESINHALTGVSNLSADGDVTISDNSNASNKLDVMTSKQFNSLTVISVVLVVYTFTNVGFLTAVCNTIWNEPGLRKNPLGKEVSVSTCRAPMEYFIPLMVMDIAGRFVLILLCVAFTIRIIRTQMNKTREQVWTVVMIVTTAISYNPSYSLWVLHDTITHNFGNTELQWVKVHKWFIIFLGVSRGVSLFVSSVGQLFYVWACSHTFGILDDNDRPSKLRFYGPKILILGSYNAYRIYLALVGISPSKLPLSTLFALIADFKVLKYWDTKLFLQVAGLGLIEFIVVIAILRRMYITANVLRKEHYVKHRGKQIGFRYFVMSNFIAYSLFIFADVAILIFMPRGFEIPSVWADTGHLAKIKHYLHNVQFGPVPRLLNYATTAMSAYVNLPADSVGFIGWFKGSDQTAENEKAPITLKVRSIKSDFNVSQMASCIVFDLVVELLNFSDVAYLQKSNAVKSQKARKFTNEKGYFLEQEIFNPGNETYGAVFTTVDQIIVAFKGTTNRENMKTDIMVKMRNISNDLPTKEDCRHKLLSSLDWKNAKIHKGFAKAYSSVSEDLIEKIEMLYSKKERPIYFTGHSLGASLATIASLDVSLSLNIKNIYVVTFGSPRCGNIFWSRACDQVVKAHWRVAMRSDIITTMPRAGYAHAGKRVVLTTSGEMFLDPNAIETILWSSVVLNASDHGKPAYKKALNLFAEKYLLSYKPEFIDTGVEVPETLASSDFDQNSKKGPETSKGTFSIGPGWKWNG